MDSIAEKREALLPAVERSEQEFREAIDELQIAVQNQLDVRTWIAERPLPWLLGGFLFGLWLGQR
jgi:hypothetical protein